MRRGERARSCYEPFQGRASNFPANRVESRQNDRFGRVVNDQIYTRQRLQSPDVPPFPAA